MIISNTSPVPVHGSFGRLENDKVKVGLLRARVTYRIINDGLALETQTPVPVFQEDEITELGIRPRDDVARTDRRLEVFCLSAAYAPGGTPTERVETSLRVGPIERRITVFGDRKWNEAFDQLSPPEPFTRMPMTLERAFGGAVAVEVDDGALLPVFAIDNPWGTGFDPSAQVAALAERLRCPSGYPRYARSPIAPNLEDPDHLIVRASDAPQSAFWCPMPVEAPALALRMLSTEPQEVAPGIKLPKLTDAHLLRATDNMIIERPEWPLSVSLIGVARNGQPIEASIREPILTVDMDVRGEPKPISLAPRSILIEPDADRISIAMQQVVAVSDDTTSCRVRFAAA